MTKSPPLCIFGEVLFDHFPDGSRVLGGAPFNVAWHLQAFGQAPHFISRVGDDDEGAEIRKAMQAWGMDTSGLQVDGQLPTGRVTVGFENGEPHYDIVKPCAYDNIAAIRATDWRLLYHGTLALRSPASTNALGDLRKRGSGSVFLDVNLRPPWWDAAMVRDLLRGANWVKLNGDELRTLTDTTDSDATALLSAYGLDGIVLTHGERGAEAITADGGRVQVAPERADKVVDTVGAGDAFASVIMLGLLENWPLPTTLQRAQLFASHIVGTRGATVDDRAFYQAFVHDWALKD